MGARIIDVYFNAVSDNLGVHEETNHVQSYAGVLRHEGAVRDGLAIVGAAEEEGGDGVINVAGGDMRRPTKAAVDEDGDGARCVLKDPAVDMAHLSSCGLEVAVEPLMLVEGEGDEGGPLALGAGAYVFVHALHRRDGGGGVDGDLAELVEGLECNDDLVGISGALLVEEGDSIVSGLVDHEDCG